MTAKQKARDLVDRYYVWTSRAENNETFAMYDAKQCALICVDEILENIPNEVMTYKPFMMNTDYWQEVKQEINKL
jgi:hypothetical protein